QTIARGVNPWEPGGCDVGPWTPGVGPWTAGNSVRARNRGGPRSMKPTRLLFAVVVFFLGTCVALLVPSSAPAYVEAPHSLGQVINLSTKAVLLLVEKVNKEKPLIVFKKEAALKGTHPTDVVRHSLGTAGYNPREWQYPMEWAEVGKKAIFFHNGGQGECCIG